MQIKIVSVGDVEVKKGAKGNYSICPITYVDPQGKVAVKKLLEFSAPEVYNQLTTASKGDLFDIITVKNKDSGYWDWTAATKITETTTQGEKEVTGRNDWVPDKDKQKMIIRQNCVTNAVNFVNGSGTFEGEKDDNLVDTVLKVAARFEEWINRSE